MSPQTEGADSGERLFRTKYFGVINRRIPSDTSGTDEQVRDTTLYVQAVALEIMNPPLFYTERLGGSAGQLTFDRFDSVCALNLYSGF